MARDFMTKPTYLGTLLGRQVGVDSLDYVTPDGGVADQTTALQSFFTACQASDAPNILRPGVYRATGALTWLPNAGVHSTILMAYGATISFDRSTSTSYHGLTIGDVTSGANNNGMTGRGWPGESLGYIMGLRIDGTYRAQTFDGSVGLRIGNMSLMRMDRVTVRGGWDIALDLLNNCYGFEANTCRFGWDNGAGLGTNWGVSLRGQQAVSPFAFRAGNDNTFRNCWVQAGISAVVVGYGYTNLHWYGGQVSGGWGLGAADDGLGVVLLNFEYTGSGGTASFNSGSAIGGVVLFDGVDFEASQYLWNFRDYGETELVVRASSVLATRAALIGVHKGTNALDSKITYENNTYQGTFSSASLISIAGATAGFSWHEDNSHFPAGSTVNGVSKGDEWASSLVAQSGMSSASIRMSQGDVQASGAMIGAYVQANGTAVANASSTFLGRKNTAGAPSTGTNSTGWWVIDSAGTVWVCTSGGTPGTWVNPGVPTGGGTGAVLLKTSGSDYGTGWSGATTVLGVSFVNTAFGPAFAGTLPATTINVFQPVGATAISNGVLTANSTQELFLEASPFVHRFFHDATADLQFRITALIGTANANAVLGLQFATTFTGTYNFAESGTTTIGGSEGVVLSSTGAATTGWRSLVAAGRADNLWWRLVTRSGAATTAPAWGRITVEFK